MTDNAASRTISLNEIGLKYFEAIQRLSDLMVFTWAGARTVSEQGYDELARSVPGLPSTEFRLSFDVAKDEAERAWLKQSVNELLGLVIVFLEDVRKLSGLVTFNAARAKASGNLATLAAELNSPSTVIDFAARLSQLKERYQIETGLEPQLLSLSSFGRCLFQQNGIIGNGETFTLNLKMVQPPAEGETQPRVADYQRTWNSGERISLARQEHAAIFTTVSLFFGAMLNAVQEYAKSSGLAPEPAVQ